MELLGKSESVQAKKTVLEICRLDNLVILIITKKFESIETIVLNLKNNGLTRTFWEK